MKVLCSTRIVNTTTATRSIVRTTACWTAYSLLLPPRTREFRVARLGSSRIMQIFRLKSCSLAKVPNQVESDGKRKDGPLSENLLTGEVPHISVTFSQQPCLMNGDQKRGGASCVPIPLVDCQTCQTRPRSLGSAHLLIVV